MKYENVVIRGRRQLDIIKKRQSDLYDAIQQEVYEREPQPESYPIVYQYKQGKSGESITEGKSSNYIGTVHNLHINDAGELIGTVIIGDMYARAVHFRGIIDNFVFSKKVLNAGGKEYTITKLIHFVIYDQTAKEEENRKKEWGQRAQKLYPAPTEYYGSSHIEGNRVKQFKETCEKILDECARTGHPPNLSINKNVNKKGE